MFFKAVAVAYFIYSLIYSASFVSVEAKKGRRVAADATAALAVVGAVLLISAIIKL